MLSVTIRNRTKSSIPKINFNKILDYALGKDYDLSLVFCGNKLSQKLNFHFRQKNNPTNILSFPLSKTEGEIFISLNIAKKQALKINENFGTYLASLFIHGLMHLKGFDHGSKMDKEEEKIRKKFKL